MNEEQLREEIKRRVRNGADANTEPQTHGFDYLYRKETIDRLVEQALLQAELNWLTAQIERGEKREKPEYGWSINDMGSVAQYERDCKYVNGYNSAVTALLTPLIERKKELEDIIRNQEGI